jgi:hypothetical protein
MIREAASVATTVFRTSDTTADKRSEIIEEVYVCNTTGLNALAAASASTAIAAGLFIGLSAPLVDTEC